ncbi:MAG: chemotaxis protein CheX [Planctomycetes bacterium]|jgi:CheY-specific phosphatase CheX|nr:chemotaxis protein CheX [Planctomycetota bacterium]
MSNAAIEQHISVIGAATVETIHSLCNVDLQQHGDAHPAVGDIFATVNLSGELNCGVCLSMPRETATQITGKFAGFAIPFDSPDMTDAIGEIANIVAGRIKACLDSKGIRAEISLPSVTHEPPKANSVSLTFDSPLGPVQTVLIPAA